MFHDLPPKLVFYLRSEFLAIALDKSSVFSWEVEDTETLKAHGGRGHWLFYLGSLLVVWHLV